MKGNFVIYLPPAYFLPPGIHPSSSRSPTRIFQEVFDFEWLGTKFAGNGDQLGTFLVTLRQQSLLKIEECRQFDRVPLNP